MYEQENEENLLQGVQFTTSISCNNPSDVSASKFQHFQGHSFKMEDQEFYLSSNEEEQSTTSIDILSNFNLTQTEIKGKSVFAKQNNQKQRLNRVSSKKHFCQKRQSNKKLSKLINLDNKLVQIKVSGLFDHSFDLISRLTQIILTEQFCKYRIYEKKLLEMIKDLQFCMSEFQKQKKSLINQINLLKTDNQNLKLTVDSLSEIIKQIQESFEKYSKKKQKNVQSFLFTSQSKTKRIEDLNHSVSSFRCFDVSQETFEETKKSKQIQTSIQTQNYAQILSEISYRLHTILDNQFTLSKSSQQKHQMSQDNTTKLIKYSIKQILTSIQKLQKPKYQSIMTFAATDSYQVKNQKLMTKFLATLSRNKPLFQKKIEQSDHRVKQFWFFVHSSLITFIGILINQVKTSQNDILQRNKKYSHKFLQQIFSVKKECLITFKQSEQRYLANIQSLLNDLTEFTSRAICRSIKQ